MRRGHKDCVRWGLGGHVRRPRKDYVRRGRPICVRRGHPICVRRGRNGYEPRMSADDH